MWERLAIDPNRNSVLYLGAPSGHGLWRSTDDWESWPRCWPCRQEHVFAGETKRSGLCAGLVGTLGFQPGSMRFWTHR